MRLLRFKLISALQGVFAWAWQGILFRGEGLHSFRRFSAREVNMLPPEIPDNEDKRLAFLQSLNILYSPIEERFERITRLLCRILDVPIAGISIVGKDLQWFKSVQGTDIIEVPRNESFCAHTILQTDTLVVPDASADKRFEGSSLVQNDPCIRFYAGFPLTLAEGIRIGAVCICDTKPREFADTDIQILEEFAQTTSSEINARFVRRVYQDSTDKP